MKPFPYVLFIRLFLFPMRKQKMDKRNREYIHRDPHQQMCLRGKNIFKLEKSPRKKALILLRIFATKLGTCFSVKNSVMLSNSIIYAYGTYSHMEINLRFCSELFSGSLQGLL